MLTSGDLSIAIGNLYEKCPTLKRYSIIAGGAIRDLVLNKPIRDIDIYILEVSSITKRIITKELREYFGLVYLKKTFGTGYSHGYIKTMFIKKLFGVEYNVIFTTLQMYDKIIDKFDCSLSKLYYDPKKHKINYSTDFKISVQKEHILFTFGTSQKYRDKILCKYPEYSWDYTGGFY